MPARLDICLQRQSRTRRRHPHPLHAAQPLYRACSHEERAHTRAKTRTQHNAPRPRARPGAEPWPPTQSSPPTPPSILLRRPHAFPLPLCVSECPRSRTIAHRNHLAAPRRTVKCALYRAHARYASSGCVHRPRTHMMPAPPRRRPRTAHACSRGKRSPRHRHHYQLSTSVDGRCCPSPLARRIRSGAPADGTADDPIENRPRCSRTHRRRATASQRC